MKKIEKRKPLWDNVKEHTYIKNIHPDFLNSDQINTSA